jgi:hypothetical protein
MEVSILNTFMNKIHHKSCPHEFNNILQNMDKYNIMGNGKLTSIKGKIILKNKIMHGGKYKEIEIDGTQYEYHLDTIEPYFETEKKISFMNITETHSNCVVLIYDSKKSGGNMLTLNGILNHEDCIRCFDDDKKYKVGDVLMQIILKMINKSKEFSHIKYIRLQDTSIKRCGDISFQLIYLKMITDGMTYYSKYGFKPQKIENDMNDSNKSTDYKKFKENKKLFEINRELSKEEIMKIIEESEINNNGIIFYKKVIKPYLKECKIIDTSKFIKKIGKFII